ncbi:MAG: hypothetical protein IPH62_00680 [Ignavibacteriae bacterium]|nr:hypothetical protein [Ignavibacteriota bacterium]MBK7103786.1 hypothetical protein [Ignavibacteriota bacterium]
MDYLILLAIIGLYYLIIKNSKKNILITTKMTMGQRENFIRGFENYISNNPKIDGNH